MERKFYHKLWNLRFKKMLELEQRSVTNYEKMLAESRRRHRGHAIEPHLEKLIADEKRHAKLVEELIKILKDQ